VIRFGQNQNLASQKHSISYGLAEIDMTIFILLLLTDLLVFYTFNVSKKRLLEIVATVTGRISVTNLK